MTERWREKEREREREAKEREKEREYLLGQVIGESVLLYFISRL